MKSKLWGVLVLIVGLGVIYWGYTAAKDSQLLSAQGVSATGTVMQHFIAQTPSQTNQNSTGTSVTVNNIRYTYEYQFTTQSGETITGRSHNTYTTLSLPQLGQKLNVKYLASNPKLSMIDSPDELGSATWPLYAIGGVITLVGIAILSGKLVGGSSVRIGS